MDALSVPLVQVLVNQVSLKRQALGRLPTAPVWWLWLITILAHILMLLGGGVSPLQAIESVDEVDTTGNPSALLQGAGGVILLLVLRSGERSPFPWLAYRVRWVVRRRRLSDLSFDELLGLLPPGATTIAQLVDRLTRSQTAKMLCAIPILYPILAELEVERIIDKYCPTEAEVHVGAVIVILCLNRSIAPRALSRVADWAAKTVIEEYTGVPAKKLNDDRLGRALDAIYPHLEEIWAEIVSQALLRYEIDLSLIFYDLTTFYFEGEYAQSQSIVIGHNRSQPGKKQRKLALNVTGRDKFPFLYQLLAGNTADVSTVQANMRRLLEVLQEQGWPVDQVLVVGDRAMLSAEIVQAYHRANLKYLGALKVMGEKEKKLIRGVSNKEFRTHPLDEDHWGVERSYTFEIKADDWQQSDRALVVLSRVLRRQKRKQRRQHIRERLTTLEAIASQRLNQRKYKNRAYAWNQIDKQVLKRSGGQFLQVSLEGEDGALRLSWQIDAPALREEMRLDGKFILITNHPSLRGAEMIARYAEKDKVEKGYRTLKGPIRLRPVFLHKEERIAGLVFVNMLALLLYSVVEMKCHRAGLMITAETVLKRFAYWAAIYTTFLDASVQLRVERLNRPQQQVVQALGQIEWPLALGGSPLILPEPATDWQVLPDNIPLSTVA